MDGNRRYAHINSLPTPLHGHSKGFTKLKQILDYCLQLGVATVTVYAFSIENFKRSPQEVSGIMDLAERHLLEFCGESHLINKHSVRIRILGSLDLLPPAVLRAAAAAAVFTANNTGPTLNICLAYTSRHEIASTVRTLVSAVRERCISVNDISQPVFDECLFTAPSKLDLLIRTSGEARLSDFLLWQATSSSAPMLHFSSALWPDFNLPEIAFIFFKWQLRQSWSEWRRHHATKNLHCRLVPEPKSRGGRIVHRDFNASHTPPLSPAAALARDTEARFWQGILDEGLSHS